MTRIFGGRGACAATALLVATVLSAGVASAQDMPEYQGVDDLPEIKLTFAEGSSQATAVTTQALVDYVTKASKGKIQIEVFWAAALMSVAEAPEGVASGLADIAQALPVYTPADFPVTNWVSQFANQVKGGQPFGKMVGMATAAEYYLRSPSIRKEYEDKGLHILGGTAGDSYDLLCSKKVTNLAEAKGKRTRTPNQAFAREVEALGMVPVPLAFTEIYESFQRGIIDCIVLFSQGYVSFGVLDIPGDKFWVNVELSGWMSNLVIVNKAKWDSLPPVAQQILTDAYAVNLQVDAQNTYKGNGDFGAFVDNGRVTALDIDADMDKVLKDQQAKIHADMATSAPPQVIDPAAEIALYTSIMEKWKKIVSEDLGIGPEPKAAKDVAESWKKTYDFAPYTKALSVELNKAYADLKQ